MPKRYVDPSKILAFLQNPWFPPGTDAEIIRQYRNNVDYRRRVLALSMSGQRLYRAFGEAFSLIVWDNANPEHTPVASGKLDPNHNYMAIRIMQEKPELVLTFGALPKAGLIKAYETLAPRHRPLTMATKHPNARFFPQTELDIFAATVLSYLVPWNENPMYNKDSR